jgi:hypothetical protein
MSGAVPMLTQYAFMGWARKPLPLGLSFIAVMFRSMVKKSNRFSSDVSRTNLSAALLRPSKSNQVQIVGIALQLTARCVPNLRLAARLYVLFALLLITLLYIFFALHDVLL